MGKQVKPKAFEIFELWSWTKILHNKKTPGNLGEPWAGTYTRAKVEHKKQPRWKTSAKKHSSNH